MIARFKTINVRLLLILATSLGCFSSLLAQDDSSTNATTEAISTNKKGKDSQKDAKKAALEAQKNANDLRKTTLLLAIAQDRDRQAAEAMEDIRSRRLRIEEDLLDADDNPKNFTKKQRSDLELQLKSLQKKEKLAQNARESANTLLLEVTQAVAAEPSKRSKFISGYEKKFGPVNDSKSVEIPIETLANTEKEPSKSVAVSDKIQNQTPTTPSVNTPVFSENMPENEPKIAVPTSKKKKETQVKQNEKPKKIAEKSPKKKVEKPTEKPKNTDDFPVVFNETPTPKTEAEPIVEPIKTEKKTAKKESKKKAKKADKPIETPTKSDDFPIVLADATQPQSVPQTMPSSTPIVEKTTETPVDSPIQNESVNEEKDVKKSKKSSKKGKKDNKNSDKEVAQGSLVSYRTYERNIDVFMNTPAPDCAIAYEGKDEFTGKMKRETMPARFFTHTDDIMRKALMDKDFMTCDITGTKVENSRYTYLNFTITILSKDIQRSIGFLDKGTPISFVFVNGNKVTLFANKTDIGVVDIDKGTTTYRAQMTAESITDMTNSELDYVRVNWTSGYEDYEIFDVDVMKNLFNCLYKK
jgi:hypothetical protein